MKIPLLVVTLICLCAGPTLALTYEMHDLGTVALTSINNHGQIVGTMQMADGTEHAFVWQQGHFTDLGIGWGQGINDLGEVTFYSGTNNNCEATIWQGGVVSAIPGADPGSCNSLAINNEGQVIGATTDGQGWIWQDGSFTYLGTMGGAVGSTPLALNDVGQVIGYTVKSDGHTDAPFIWQEGVMSTIPGIPGVDSVSAINDSGVIAGSDRKFDEIRYAAWTEACIWQNGTRAFLGTLANPRDWWQISLATDINNHGQVVGWSNTDDADGRIRAFVWQDGVMMDLGTLGGEDSRADAVNDNGWIIGWSETMDGQMHGVLWTPVPEPSSLLGVVAGVLLIFRRPRSRS